MKLEVNDEGSRLDSYIALNSDLSRSRVAKLISDNKVLVNGKEKSASYKVKLGDVITIRGKGRFIVKEFNGSTRSGRTVVKIEKYI